MEQPPTNPHNPPTMYTVVFETGVSTGYGYTPFEAIAWAKEYERRSNEQFPDLRITLGEPVEVSVEEHGTKCIVWRRPNGTPTQHTS